VSMSEPSPLSACTDSFQYNQAEQEETYRVPSEPTITGVRIPSRRSVLRSHRFAVASVDAADEAGVTIPVAGLSEVAIHSRLAGGTAERLMEVKVHR
jgi:hypothetical protein